MFFSNQNKLKYVCLVFLVILSILFMFHSFSFHCLFVCLCIVRSVCYPNMTVEFSSIAVLNCVHTADTIQKKDFVV